MRKISIVMLCVLIVGFIMTFGRRLLNISFKGDWLVGPVIIVFCYIIAIFLGIYYYLTNKE